MNMLSTPQIWVRTSFFRIEPGEDRQTNPGRYGKKFANWLQVQLKTHGQSAEDVFPTDWGWCVALIRKPYPVWIGCGSRMGKTDEWGAFVAAEPSLIQRFFIKLDPQPIVGQTYRRLEEVMQRIPELTDIWVGE